MKFQQLNSEIFSPKGLSENKALSRTTHLGISAHQDDLEIMGIDGILHGFENDNDWFTGVVVTDGRSSPRSGLYSELSDEMMMHTRYEEQRKAAIIGNYNAQIFLGYRSAEIKSVHNHSLQTDLVNLLKATKPRAVYTHNLADKHPSHVAVVINVIEAIRLLPKEFQPDRIYGCEVWRDLDWIPDSQKIVFDCSSRPNLQQALIAIFDSQISGGKRYDLATMGRRMANATFYESHFIDKATHIAFAMDLTPLIKDVSLGYSEYIGKFIRLFEQEVCETINLFIDNK